MGWQQVTLQLQEHACTLPVVVLSSQNLAFQAVLGLDFLSTSGMQMDVGHNTYWFRDNPKRTYFFEKDTANLTEWSEKGLLSFYSAIDPQPAAHPVLSDIDTKWLCKAVEKAQLDGMGKLQFHDLLLKNAEVCTSSLG